MSLAIGRRGGGSVLIRQLTRKAMSTGKIEFLSGCRQGVITLLYQSPPQVKSHSNPQQQCWFQTWLSDAQIESIV
jgi:hypothetical protein